MPLSLPNTYPQAVELNDGNVVTIRERIKVYSRRAMFNTADPCAVTDVDVIKAYVHFHNLLARNGLGIAIQKMPRVGYPEDNTAIVVCWKELSVHADP